MSDVSTICGTQRNPFNAFLKIREYVRAYAPAQPLTTDTDIRVAARTFLQSRRS